MRSPPAVTTVEPALAAAAAADADTISARAAARARYTMSGVGTLIKQGAGNQ